MVFMTSDLSCSPLHIQTGQTALHIASWKGHDQIVELLVKKEVDVNNQIKVRPLMLVCLFLHKKWVLFNVKNTWLDDMHTMNKASIMSVASRIVY